MRLRRKPSKLGSAARGSTLAFISELLLKTKDQISGVRAAGVFYPE
jgi:hypothetical protein